MVCFNPSTKLIRVRPAELIVARSKELSTRRKFVSYFAPLVGRGSDEERLLREVGTGMQVVHERCCGLDVHKILPNAPFGLSRKNVCYSE